MTTLHIHQLSKRYRDRQVIDGLSFTASPGRVTGFLGPNGSGKTTTMRIALGLAEPTGGRVDFDGIPYKELHKPIHQVGALITGDAFHPGRSGRQHLQVIATAAGIAPKRADLLLGQVGLEEAAKRRVGGYSLGMRQRLGIAAALLGDPEVLILDEPLNGLDPDGILWIRQLLRRLAGEGRTVLLSSHLIAEVEMTVDDVVVISRGALVVSGALDDLAGPARTIVRTPHTLVLTAALIASGRKARIIDDHTVEVIDASAADVGRLASREGAVILSLTEENEGLEQLFHSLTATHAPLERAS